MLGWKIVQNEIHLDQKLLTRWMAHDTGPWWGDVLCSGVVQSILDSGQHLQRSDELCRDLSLSRECLIAPKTVLVLLHHARTLTVPQRGRDVLVDHHAAAPRLLRKPNPARPSVHSYGEHQMEDATVLGLQELRVLKTMSESERQTANAGHAAAIHYRWMTRKLGPGWL